MDDITEVYVVEEYDLEEGEITDDGVIDLEEPPEPKQKKLPKRYCLHQKKVLNERHKKECKHSRHKVKNKEKSSPISNGVHKKHKSSCPLQYQASSTGKHDSVMHKPPVNNLTKPSNNNSSTFKSAFKNFTSPPRPVQNFHNPCINIRENFDEIDNYPDLLLAYRKSRGYLDHKSKLKEFGNQVKHTSPKNSVKQPPSETFAKAKGQTKHSLKEKSSPKQIESKQSKSEKVSPKKIEVKHPINKKAQSETKQLLHEMISLFTGEANLDHNKRASQMNSGNKHPLKETTSVPELRQKHNGLAAHKVEKRRKEEGSDDEDELRKIALATCVKRNMERQKASENINNFSSSPSHSLSNQSSVTMLVNGDNSSDNYEVVDMDLDDENFTEDLEVEDNLFVIDNTPIMSSEFNHDVFYGQSYVCDNLQTEGYLPPKKVLPNQAQATEDFEEAVLRAELIASINSKKIVDDEPKPTSSLAVKFPEFEKKEENASLQSLILKPPAAYTKGQTFHPFSANVKRTDVVKLNNSKLPNSKKIISPKPRNINATQERLIITLNNDSSSEESDEDGEESNENGQESVVTSIDALISNARHKSDIKANGANLNHVSSLSKAQQEEYKKLRNILAEKEPMTIIPQSIKEKSSVGHQNLNYITNKISVAKEKLDKEMEVLCNTEKDVLNQKKVYIASKLKFQHLQEQLHAAKLTKAANLKNWKLCEAKLVNAKNIVAKQKALISWLEDEFNSRQLQIDQNSSSPIL